jgi:hypothetical protein
MLISDMFVNPASGLSGVIQGARQRLGQPGDILYYRSHTLTSLQAIHGAGS